VGDLNPGTGEGVLGFDRGRGFLDGIMLFSGDNGTGIGFELWRTDGTAAGTALVKDISPGTTSSYPSRFARMGSYLYFSATSVEHGNELWRSDGTPAGTTRITDINSGPASAGITSVVLFKGRLWFSAIDPVYGREIFTTDGTPEGTVRVTDLASGSGTIMPTELIVAGDNLFIHAQRDADGAEVGSLWQTDGTAPFRLLVRDIGSFAMPDGYATLGNLLLVGTTGTQPERRAVDLRWHAGRDHPESPRYLAQLRGVPGAGLFQRLRPPGWRGRTPAVSL
jgi:ELWxxDGT repeat protein